LIVGKALPGAPTYRVYTRIRVGCLILTST